MKRRERTHRHILEVASELFAEHGFDKTSMRDIAQAARVSSATLYNHFDSKEALIDAAVNSRVRAVVRDVAAKVQQAKTPLDRLLVTIGEFSLRVMHEPLLGALMADALRGGVRQTLSRTDVLEEMTTRFSENAAAAAVAQGAIECEDPEALIAVVRLSVRAWCADEQRRINRVSAERLVAMLRTIIRGMAPNAS